MNELVTEFWPVQPEPGSFADQLIKKGEVRGEVRGITLGEVLASIKTIRSLQLILGDSESAAETFAGKSLAELERMIETLRAMIGNRDR